MMRSIWALLVLASVSWGGPILYLTNSANQLLRIDATTPGTINATVGITGLQSGENILGIDIRPANGQLYALGSTSRLYTVSLLTGAATQVGSAGAFTLSGASFGFDFNPTVDRIRVVSNLGQNLRLNPNDGSLAATDTPLNGADTGAVGSAYTNSFAGAGTTTLYAIDSATDQLYIQTNPNGGVLALAGNLGVDISANAGFDIHYPSNVAYAAMIPSIGGGFSQLYTINLATGAATLLGSIGTGQTITGLAVVSDAAVPEPSAILISGAVLLLMFGIRRKVRT